MDDQEKRTAIKEFSRLAAAFADGSGFTLEDGVLHYIRHVAFHRELIDRNIRMFAAVQGSRRE